MRSIGNSIIGSILGFGAVHLPPDLMVVGEVPPGCTPNPAPRSHPGRNPRYNGQGFRYFERSRYVPHTGAKEARRYEGRVKL